jgi:hypothetical protein
VLITVSDEIGIAEELTKQFNELPIADDYYLTRLIKSSVGWID